MRKKQMNGKLAGMLAVLLVLFVAVGVAEEERTDASGQWGYVLTDGGATFMGYADRREYSQGERYEDLVILPVEGGFLCVGQGLDLENCPFLGGGWTLLLDANGNAIAADSTPDIGGGQFDVWGASMAVDGEVLLCGTVLESPGFPDRPFAARLMFPEAYAEGAEE